MRRSGSRTLIALLLATAGCASPSAPEQPAAAVVEAPKAVLVIGTTSPGLGLLGHPITFNASGSRGSGLTYKIDFGDGEMSREAVTAHLPVLVKPWGGSFTATLTVTDRLGRSDVTTATYTVTTINSPAAGFWTQGPVVPTIRRIYLSHSGTELSGWYDGPEGKSLRVSGTIVGERDVQLRVGGGVVELTGSVEWGTSSLGGTISLRLTLRGGPSDGQTFNFYPYDPY